MDERRVPPPALAMCVTQGPPWFVPAEAPACGTVLSVPAEDTNDGVARRFVCDRAAGHTDQARDIGDEDRHAQVTDNDGGREFTWPAR